MKPIGVVRSPFKEKFGIPRQPGLAPEVPAMIELPGTRENREAVRGLEEFSHVWVLFIFHESAAEGWRPLVRPPRLGGARKTGVFATRSPHRPNPIGLSVVALERVETAPKQPVRIHVRGGDLLEGTPVLDLKPYLPYADAPRGARAAPWAKERPKRVAVKFTPTARARCRELEALGYAKLEKLIRQVLALDPRPAFLKGHADGVFHATRLLDLDIDWEVNGPACRVTSIRPANSTPGRER